jgi:outer membrane lipoprotein-sorting protein
MKNNGIESRLVRLGQQLAEQPSIVDRVMDGVDRAEPARVPRFNQARILAMLRTPRSLAAAAAVLALVVFGLRPWATDSDRGAWWLAPPAAWAGELQAAIEQAGQRGFSCREQFINVTGDGSQSTSSTTSTLFTAGNRYRRDSYDHGKLRESQWYVLHDNGLTTTSVRYGDKTYTVTLDPKARQTDADPTKQFELLSTRLDESGRRIGTARVEGHDAVEFEIGAKQLDAQVDDATMHVWLNQATKMPLKITYQFTTPGALGQVVAMTLIQDHFDWNPTLPADTFEPAIPPGFTKVESQ